MEGFVEISAERDGGDTRRRRVVRKETDGSTTLDDAKASAGAWSVTAGIVYQF